MRTRVFVCVVFAFLASASFAVGSLQTFRLDFNQARAAIKGDTQGLNYLKSCADEHYVCAMLAETWHDMDETERAQAEELAATRIARWEDSVRAQAAQDIRQHLEIRRRINPQYPRGMAINRVNGYALVYLEFNEDGNITDAIEMASSHWEFGKEARRAVRRWNVRAPVDGDPVAGTAVQRVDFVLE